MTTVKSASARLTSGICGGRQLFLPVNLPKLKEDGYFRLTSSHLITGYMTTANTLFTDEKKCTFRIYTVWLHGILKKLLDPLLHGYDVNFKLIWGKICLFRMVPNVPWITNCSAALCLLLRLITVVLNMAKITTQTGIFINFKMISFKFLVEYWGQNVRS